MSRRFGKGVWCPIIGFRYLINLSFINRYKCLFKIIS